MGNRFDIPFLGYGMGLRIPHYEEIFATRPAVDWFEIISENFMDTGGRPVRNLERVLEHYPVVMHGVSLSIGSTDPINKIYLRSLKQLAEWVDPPWISDHLCWTGVHGKNSHDLLPMPYTEESLAHLVGRIRYVQDFLGRPLILENPSTYLEFNDSTIPEWEFIARMAEEADCGLLLDANNVYVTCYNHRYDPKTYIDAIPTDRVVQIHLAGHENKGNHLIDTHEGPVIDDVWQLYRYILACTGAVSTMVEWDENIPEFSVVLAEVDKARQFAKESLVPNHLVSFNAPPVLQENVTPRRLQAKLDGLQEAIFSGNITGAAPEAWIRPKRYFLPEEQLAVYVEGYRYRLFDLVSEDFPALRCYLGDAEMDALLDVYVEHVHSESYNVAQYPWQLPEFIKNATHDGKQGGARYQIAHEIALLEAALSCVFDMEETAALAQDSLAAVSAEGFLDVRLPLRKACELLAFTHNINAYYHAVKEEKALPKIAEQESYVAVFRHDDVVWRLELEKEEYAMLQALQQGETVEVAMEAALVQTVLDEAALMEKCQTWFARWMQHHVLAALPEAAQGSKAA